MAGEREGGEVGQGWDGGGGWAMQDSSGGQESGFYFILGDGSHQERNVI